MSRSYHSSKTQTEDYCKHRLEGGIAKVALRHKREKAQFDSNGNPMQRAVGYASGYSEKALERMARGKTRSYVVL